MKTCSDCRAEKPYAEFRASARGTLSSYCRPCYSKRESWNRKMHRGRAIDRLGGSCVMCGNSDKRILEIDHINSDGFLERPVNGGHGIGLQAGRVLTHPNPTDKYQILCPNCHSLKTWWDGGEREWPSTIYNGESGEVSSPKET